MKFREIVRYELQHSLHSVTTWIYAAILFALGFMTTNGYASTSDGIYSPSAIAYGLVIVNLFGGLAISAFLFSDAAVRDSANELEPLLFTSPVSKAEYLGGRFVATLSTNALVLFAAPLGAALPPLVGWGDPGATFGPYRIAAYLQPYLFLLLPNLVFQGAVLFAVGVLTRQVIPVFLVGIGLFMVSLGSIGIGENVTHSLLALLSPTGLGAVNVLRASRPPAEIMDLIGMSALLLWNRVLLLTLAALVLLVVHRTFRFAHADGQWRGDRRHVVVDAADRAVPVVVPRIAPTFGWRTTVRQTLAVARQSLAEVAGNGWFIVVLIACTVVGLVVGNRVGSVGNARWPATMYVVMALVNPMVNRLVYLLLALYAGELVWKDRETRAAEIADAAPVSDTVALLGRFVALVALLVMVQAALMIGGILSQASQGYYNLELGLYLRVLFGLNLATCVLVAALAIAIHVLVNQKYLGHLVVLTMMVAMHFAGRIGWQSHQHHLLYYGTDPAWTYSDVNGFAAFVEPFVWFKLYWAAWAVLITLIAALLRVRGRESGWPRRFHQARARLTVAVLRTASAAMVLIVVLGGFIFYNTNVLNEYVSADDLRAASAAYEARYGRYQSSAQPVPTAVGVRVEIYPEEPAVDMRGTYALVNRSDGMIDSVHVTLDPAIEARALSFDRAAEAVLVDEEHGYRIFMLEQPLGPGDSLRLHFDVAFRPRGFPNSGIQTSVVDNAAFFDRSWLPSIGYQPASAAQHEDHVEVETIIGTAVDHIAVTSGDLQRSWIESGRRYFHYQSDVPIEFSGVVFSARYAVLEDRWNDVALVVYHHPAHDYNLDRLVRGMKAALAYFGDQLGAYPTRHLRIVEVPRYITFGNAGAHTIALSENTFLSRVLDGRIDQPFHETVRAVAHQWWGGMTRGAPVLTGALAEYGALIVTEITDGPETARRIYNLHLQRYLDSRSDGPSEVPLLEVADWRHSVDHKGAIALYALREHIGEAAVNTALRRYFEKSRDTRGSLPQLYAELRAVTPDSLRYLLTDWFETITLWDVSIERVVSEPTGTNEYLVTLDVMARKLRADSGGNETDVSMNDWIEIGIFEGGPPIDTDLNLRFDQHGEPMHLERHRIRSGRQTIRIVVPREPVRAGIDPYRKLIDREGRDNVASVTKR